MSVIPQTDDITVQRETDLGVTVGGTRAFWRGTLSRCRLDWPISQVDRLGVLGRDEVTVRWEHNRLLGAAAVRPASHSRARADVAGVRYVQIR